VTLVRNLPTTRTIEYQDNGDFTAANINNDQDYQTYLILDGVLANERAISLPASVQGFDAEMPPPVPLAFFQYSADGLSVQTANSLLADGILWTAADVYTKTEIGDYAKLWDSQTVTHNITSDSNYTLTATQNLYGRIIITDTGVVLTAARDIIVDGNEKNFTVYNNTAQILTVKTLAGTGIDIDAGVSILLYNDGTNVIRPKAYPTIDTGSSIHADGNIKYKVIDITILASATNGSATHGVSSAFTNHRILSVASTAKDAIIPNTLRGGDGRSTYSISHWSCDDTTLTINNAGAIVSDVTYKCLITYV
jgi:hypothetical protein